MNTLKTSLYAGLMLCLSILTACGDRTEPVPANVINSSAGLRIDLEWSTGGSIAASLDDSDLDLFLMKGTTEVAKSTTASQFEVVRLQDIFADGEYTIKVKAYDASKRTNYTLYVKGDDEGELKSYTGIFLAGDSGINVEFLKIRKSGTKYTIIEM
jgi:hypothetical protein